MQINCDQLGPLGRVLVDTLHCRSSDSKIGDLAGVQRYDDRGEEQEILIDICWLASCQHASHDCNGLAANDRLGGLPIGARAIKR